MSELKIIGRKERIDLPGLGLFGLLAKIDTGAYTSSMHCEAAEVLSKGLSCQFRDDKNVVSSFTFAKFNKRNVKSSNGIVEIRYAVWTKIKLGGELFEIELTLTNRSEMKTSLLLGRKFLSKKYLVDVSQKNKLKTSNLNLHDKA
jgi:hypothetical protein